MLDRLHHAKCIECGKPFGAPDFGYHAGRIENGPAYWSERGLLCSQGCAQQHALRRRDAGDPMRAPADNPLERTGIRGGA